MNLDFDTKEVGFREGVCHARALQHKHKCRISPVLLPPLIRGVGTPQFWKHALGMKRPFSEQLSEFRSILGATLGIALTTYKLYEALCSERLSERLSELLGSQNFGPNSSKLGWSPRARIEEVLNPRGRLVEPDVGTCPWDIRPRNFLFGPRFCS